MAYNLQPGGYVKFIRGTPTTWSLIETKDNDTLYFIVNPDSDTGKLYLGNKLISGGDITSNLTLNELQDILLTEDIQNNSLLVYDKNQSMWVNKPLVDILSTMISVMQPATEDSDGASGLVPSPLQGQQGLYLRGDATWADPTASLTQVVNNLVDGDVGLTIREIANEEVAKIVADAPEQFDTLKEIADWITNNTDTEGILKLDARVESLEDIIKDQTETNESGETIIVKEGLQTIVNNLQTVINGNEDGSVSGLVNRVDTLERNYTILDGNVDTLTSSLTEVQGDIITINNTIDNLDSRMRWSDIVAVSGD